MPGIPARPRASLVAGLTLAALVTGCTGAVDDVPGDPITPAGTETFWLDDRYAAGVGEPWATDPGWLVGVSADRGTALVQERDRAVGRDLRTGAEKYVVEGVFCPWFGSTGGVAYCRDGRLSTAASTGTDVRAIEIGTGRSQVVHTAPGVWMVDPNPSTREGTTVVHLGAHGSGDEGILLGLREGKVSWVVTSTDAARCHPLTTMIGCTSPGGAVAYARDDCREVLRVDRWVSWLDDGYVVDERAGSVQTATAHTFGGATHPVDQYSSAPEGSPDGGLRRPTVQQVLDAPSPCCGPGTDTRSSWVPTTRRPSPRRARQ